MIINSGQRTDIPAFYSKWFINRIREGYVLVRNPYNPSLVTRYELYPEVVDILSFCSKNPAPMLKYLDELSKYRQFWSVTITPYDKDIEPNVPDKDMVIDAFINISKKVGKSCMSWRYDPILINEKYTLDFHVKAFENMAKRLCGYTDKAVISFIDIYAKTLKNFPQATEVKSEDRDVIGREFSRIAENYGIKIYSCLEGVQLEKYGIDASGCLTKEVLEGAFKERLDVPKTKGARQGCNCLLGNDIGQYNTCPHMCRYCYANYDRKTVMANYNRHIPTSPLLIGELMPGDIVKAAKQFSYISDQLILY